MSQTPTDRPSSSEQTLADKETTSLSSRDPEKATPPSTTPPAAAAAASSPPAASPADGPPDGGTKAWLCVLGGWCTAFSSFGWLNSIGVFQSYYQSTLLSSYSSSTVSWIPSLQIFFILGLGPVVGGLYDRYGPRWLLAGGSFLHVFGIMMTSISDEYWQVLLSQGVVSAVGASMIFQPRECPPTYLLHGERY